MTTEARQETVAGTRRPMIGPFSVYGWAYSMPSEAARVMRKFEIFSQKNLSGRC
jgi:hypothetical protein